MTARKEEGFTLIEILVAIALLAFISVGFYSVMLSVVRGSETAESVVRISEEARAGFNRMIRDAREAEAITISEPDRLGIRTDFNDDGLIQNPNSSGDYESLIFQFAGQRITIRTSTGGQAATLIDGVEPLPGNTGVFSYSSNLLEFDANNDGITTCLELSVSSVGDGDAQCDAGEHLFISNIDFAFQIESEDQASIFHAQAQLRNSRD